MGKLLKKIIFTVILNIIEIKCIIYFLLYGNDGILMILERIPKIFIIPILKRYGAKIGLGSQVLRGIIIHGLRSNKPRRKIFQNLVIGKNVYIGRNALFDLSCPIVIDDDSMFGADCQIWTHVGDFTFNYSDYHENLKPVYIGKGVLCWSKVLISAGVSIGDYARVAGGSIVVNDINTMVFVGGVPAKFIRNRKI